MPQFTHVAELKNSIQASLVSAYLKESGIPHRVRSFHDTAYSTVFQVQHGWGFIEAPAEYEPEIRRVIEDLEGSTDDSSG